MKIEEQISELLYEHDCVIVPDFGGFVCNYAPARIDPVKHLFEPPAKKIIFNKGLTRNDGVLSNYIAGKFKLPYSQAIAAIAKEVNGYKENLEREKRLTLDNIGLLYLDETGNLLFRQDNKMNYLVESFGLPSFYYQPIDEGDFGKRVKEQKVKRVRVYATAAIITALVASVSWFALLEKQNNLQFSNLNFFSKNNESEYSLTTDTYKDLPKSVFQPFDVIIVSSAGNPDANTTASSTANSMPLPKNTAPIAKNIVSAPTKTLPVNPGKYFTIIAGSFAEKAHADNLISQYSSKYNIRLSIVGRNPQGLYMVGYGKFPTHDAAAAQRDGFSKNYIKGAWVKAI